MQPISKIIITVLIATCLCVFAVFLLNKGYKNYAIHGTKRLSELLHNKTNYDLIFIGSSRTHTSIQPKIIDSALQCNSYNAGIEGGNLLEFDMMFHAYLENHPAPKLLVLTLDLYSFNLDRPFFNYTQYLNYIDNKIIDKALCSNGHNTLLYKAIPFATITDFDDFSRGNAIKGLLHKGGTDIPQGEIEYKGFLSNTNIGITDTMDYPKIKQKIANTAITYFQKIIATCKTKNIKLIVSYAPEFNFGLQNSTENANAIFDTIYSFTQELQIPYLRHDSLSICKDASLFANIGHLNAPGANVYSQILATDLKKYY